MTEATWGEEARTPEIDWRMSAALEDVPRGYDDVAEVTNLEGAVRAWRNLDLEHRVHATLTLEHPILIDGLLHQSFTGEGIDVLANRLPERASGR